MWDIRTDMIVEYAQGQTDATAGWVVRCILSRYPYDFARSHPLLSVDDIVETCNSERESSRVNGHPVFSRQNIVECLEELGSRPVPIVKRRILPSGEEGFVVAVDNAAELLKLAHIKSAIKERYGVLGVRIFSLLLSHKLVEVKQICELTMEPKKKVRRALYHMLKVGFVYLQVVQKGDMQGRSFHLWGAPIEKVCARVLDSLCFSWLNMKRRLEHENAVIRPIVDKVKAADPITPEEKQLLDQFRLGSARLCVAMFRADDLIMLFKEF